MAKVGKLLIVDDESDLLDIITDYLRNDVADIHRASNGLEALEKIRKESFDAVLSDINMPKMTGMELLTNIRKEGFLTPFIILTGYGDKKSAIDALKLNAYDFLEKPCDPIQIVQIVTKAIELGQQFNAWKEDKDVVVDLQTVRDSNAIEAEMRLKNKVKKH